MIVKTIATAMIAGLLLLGCAKRPQFSYDPAEDVSVARYRQVAFDPRTEMLFVEDGKHPVDASFFKARVVRELQAMGYELVPPEQARLWLDVFAMSEGGNSGGRSGAPSGMGQEGMGGHRGGGGGGRRGGPGGGGETPPSGGSARGPVTLVVALLDPADAHIRWRGVLEVRSESQPARGPGAPAPEDNVKRLLEPLREPRP